MRIAVIGLGAVGARAARQLASTDGVDAVLLRDERPERLDEVAASLGPVAVAEPAAITAPPEADAVVLALPSGRHAELAGELIDLDVPVVSASDAMDDARALLDLDPEAKARGVPLVVGAAFSPGLTCVLARHAAAELDEVDEIHVARLGTGRPGLRPPAPPGPRAARPSTGATAAGCSARAARAASCAGSPTPSAPPTATGPRCPTPCSSCRPSPAWTG